MREVILSDGGSQNWIAAHAKRRFMSSGDGSVSSGDEAAREQTAEAERGGGGGGGAVVELAADDVSGVIRQPFR